MRVRWARLSAGTFQMCGGHPPSQRATHARQRSTVRCDHPECAAQWLQVWAARSYPIMRDRWARLSAGTFRAPQQRGGVGRVPIPKTDRGTYRCEQLPYNFVELAGAMNRDA